MSLSAVVVDDSIVFRKVVRDTLEEVGGVRVVDVAGNGNLAVQKIRQHKPDFVTLDLEMPGLDGLGVLEALKADNLPTNILMVSSFTRRGADSTTKALSLGAFDFILKPDFDDAKKNKEDLKRQIGQRVKALSRRNPGSLAAKSPVRKGVAAPASVSKPAPRRGRVSPPEAIVVGISTGGPQALRKMISKLPADLPVPVVIVQHMPAMFTSSMARDLDGFSALQVVEAEDRMPIQAGSVYIAPGGKQMRISGFPGALRAEVTDDPPERSCKPSVDYMFRSADKVLGPKLLGLIMTGMGDDGLEGCRLLRKSGATVWAQDEASSTVYGMPRQIVDNGLADEVLPLSQISNSIARFCHRHVGSRTGV
ncbi:MAG: chemotaxis response regulator protein-glutamate methylesterase [Planctomycetota bacterium]